MKYPFFKVSLLLVAASLSTVCAQEGRRLSREELIAKRAEAMKKNSALAPKGNSLESKHPTQITRSDRSVKIGFNGLWTMVPIGSVLGVPANYKDRVDLTETEGKFVSFPEFLGKNRSWISVFDVSLEQARGDEKISEKALTSLSKSDRLTIAVLQGGPITVRPPKDRVQTAQAEVSK